MGSQSNHEGMSRRDFFWTAGATAAGASLASSVGSGMAAVVDERMMKKRKPRIMGAFLYPPTEILRKEGYFSWPGAHFDAEGRQKEYMEKIFDIEKRLNMTIEMEEVCLDLKEQAEAFIRKVDEEKPDGLLLIPFKKGHRVLIDQILDATSLPTVIMATLGVLLAGHVRGFMNRPGVYMINSQDNLEAVEYGLAMVRTGIWMRDSLIVNIDGSERTEIRVPVIGTRVRQVPHQRFYSGFQKMQMTPEVEKVARRYLAEARRIVQPTEQDIYEAARCYFVFREIIEEEGADAVMMNCLPGLKRPHQHVPPCMGYMDLRDEGVPMGCESDLDATLSMMFIQYMFNRPAFQHNPSVETEKNHYFCAHCVSASRMSGFDSPPEPYELWDHAEAGWGTVPRVLMRKGPGGYHPQIFIKQAGRKTSDAALLRENCWLPTDTSDRWLPHQCGSND